jgi:hypothetical protein
LSGDKELLPRECLNQPGQWTCKKENGQCNGTCPAGTTCGVHPTDSNYCKCNPLPPPPAETCPTATAPQCGGTCNGNKKCTYDPAGDKCYCKDPCSEMTAVGKEPKTPLNCGGGGDFGDPSCDVAYQVCKSNLKEACEKAGGKIEGDISENGGCTTSGNWCTAGCKGKCCIQTKGSSVSVTIESGRELRSY